MSRNTIFVLIYHRHKVLEEGKCRDWNGGGLATDVQFPLA
jgi:hypothetical protein